MAATLKKAARLIYGVAFHDIYHAGQIRLLRRLMGEATDEFTVKTAA